MSASVGQPHIRHHLAPRWRGVGLFFALCLAARSAAFTLTLLDEPTLKAQLTAEAEGFSREQPLIASLKVEAPKALQIELGDLRGALRGFRQVELFAAGRTEAEVHATTTWRLRLTPSGEGPWRLLPLLLSTKDSRTGVRSEWLTCAVRFPEPLPLPEATGSPVCDLAPAWIAPGWRTFGRWFLWGVLSLGGLGVIAWLALRLLRRIRRERLLTPVERAQLELEQLLLLRLPEQGFFKRFYAELTAIVRRYHERAYHLRATRQTTPEFLTALAIDPRFSEETRRTLAAFLSAADRIKFANVTASNTECDDALVAARSTLHPPAPAQE